ncbi:DLW-39 family protein [Kribbella deserti]|uniref:DLW-39 family protein n=1 Tax=Kribbella deserti TaxID=1926257 RepID=A0ABV6QTR8_9ACTN
MFKKILLATVAGVGGYLVFKKTQQAKADQAKAEQDLWAEAVDPVTPGH